MDCTAFIESIPAVKRQSLIHWNLHLLAYASSISALCRLLLGQKGDHERRRGEKESKGDDSRLHSSDESSATLKEGRGQEEKAMVADLEVDGRPWIEEWPALDPASRPFDRISGSVMA